MDKNAVTGIVLITAMLMGWFYFFAPEPPPQVPPQAAISEKTEVIAEDSLVPGEPKLVLAQPDSTHLKDAYSDFFPLVSGTNQEITVKTDLLTVNLNTKGGSFATVSLNKHLT